MTYLWLAGNFYCMLGLFRDNGKENGNYPSILQYM